MDDHSRIDLHVPADPALVRMVRLAVVSAVDADTLDFDTLEDLRLAASEAFGALVGRARTPGARIQVTITVTDEPAVTVTVTSDEIRGDDTYTDRVLAACCDHVHVDPAGTITFTRSLR